MKLSFSGYAWLIPAEVKELDQCPIYPLWNRKVTLDSILLQSPPYGITSPETTAIYFKAKHLGSINHHRPTAFDLPGKLNF